MSEEHEPKQPHLDGRIYSPWFPYAGDDPDPWSRVSKALPIVRYEPRPDPLVERLSEASRLVWRSPASSRCTPTGSNVT